MRDPFPDAISDGPGPVPRTKYGFDGAPQLGLRFLRERFAGSRLHDGLVFLNQILQRLGRNGGVVGHTAGLLRTFEGMLEQRPIDTLHNAAVHLDESAVRVVGEALVVGLSGQAFDALVVQAEVEDGVHHAGHRELGPRAHRNEKRIGRIAEALAHLLFDLGHLRRDLIIETDRPSTGHVGATSVGRNREAGRDGQPQNARHLREVGALPTQKVLEEHGRLLVLVVEGVRVTGGGHGGVLKSAMAGLGVPALPCDHRESGPYGCGGESTVRAHEPDDLSLRKLRSGPVSRGPSRQLRRADSYDNLSRRVASSSAIGTRTCVMVSRSRTVTA